MVVLVMMVLVLVLVEKEEEGKEEKKGSPDGSGAQGRLAAGAQKSIPSSNLVNIPYTCHRSHALVRYECHMPRDLRWLRLAREESGVLAGLCTQKGFL